MIAIDETIAIIETISLHEMIAGLSIQQWFINYPAIKIAVK